MCQMEVENSFFFNNLTKRFLFCVHESLLHTYCFARLFTSPVYSHRSRPPLNPFYIIVNRSPLMVMGKKTAFGSHCIWWKSDLHCVPTVQHVKCVYVVMGVFFCFVSGMVGFVTVLSYRM